MNYNLYGVEDLAVGVWCSTACANGFSLHRAEVAVYAAAVTVSDPTAPTVSAVSGAAAANGWLSGTVGVGFSASDVGGGLKSLRVTVGGVTRLAKDENCDYAKPAPCTLGTVSWSGGPLDTTKLSDGSHTLRAQAVDASGAVGSSAPRTIKVDNTAPAAPALAVVASDVSAGARTLLIGAPQTDSGSPVVTRRIRVCREGLPLSCAVAEDMPAGTRSASVVLPEDGRWVARVWDVDAAGQEDAGTAGSVTLVYDRTTTTPTPPPPVPADPVTPPVEPVPDGRATHPMPTPIEPAAGPAPPLGPGNVTPQPFARKDPRLRIALVARTRQGVRVAGSVATGALEVAATMTLRDPRTGRRSTVERRVRPRGGRFVVDLAVPKRLRGLTSGRTVTIRSRSTPGLLPARRSARVP